MTDLRHSPSEMARWWGMQPQEQAESARDGITSGIWRFDREETFEITAHSNPQTHICTVILAGSMDVRYFANGRRRFHAPHNRTGMINIVPAGERPRSIIRWSSLSPDRLRTAQGGLAPWRVERAADRMLADFAEDVSLADLAAEVGLSPYHFCRAFARSTGLPPHRWRLTRRIERACALLELTDLSIGAVAAQVGYDDPNQLARVFRKALGVSPSQYRRERRQ